jgi:hypothetical protein
MSTKYIQATFEKNFDAKTVEETRTIEFIINSERKDRHKDILDYNNWKLDNYNANPIVGYQHNVYGDNMCSGPNPDDVLGKGKAYPDTFKGMRVIVSSVEFEPKEINTTAEKVFRKVLFGSLNAASVGIVPTGKIKTEYTKSDKGEIIDQTNYWPGQELLEWSIVNIPANADAVRRSMKNHTIAALDFAAKLLEEYSIKDLKQMRVQEILDAIEKKTTSPTAEVLEAVIELEVKGPDPDLNKYLERLKKLKNG